jgi:general stress protein YciG
MTNSKQTRRKFSQLVAGNPPLVSLEPEKSSKERGGKHCKARTRAGGACHAPAVEAGLCFFHANPEKLAELGRQGGQKNRRWPLDGGSLPHRSLKSINEVSGVLEETINRVRQGPFDLRAANAIGFLASILLKALDSGRVEERLAHLEAVMTGKRGTDFEFFDFKSAKESTHEQQ